MLNNFCFVLPLKTGTIILGLFNMVSVNFPSTLLTIYRNGSSFFQKHTTLELKKLQFIRVAKILTTSIQITFQQSTAILTKLLKKSAIRNMMSKKNIIIFLYISE
jgi:hypothetical protein